MREKPWFAAVYMFVVTAFFSSIVIGFSRLTEKRVGANTTLAFEKAVLSVLPGMSDADVRGPELHRRFVEAVSLPDDSSGGAYVLRNNGRVVAFALPISGQGFWAPVKGVIGVAADRETITGVYFYEQNETPGLGAQITTDEFRNQFEGKVLSTNGKAFNIKRSGTALGDSDVHAVTGATQTSMRLEKIINTAVQDWRAKPAQPQGSEK